MWRVLLATIKTLVNQTPAANGHTSLEHDGEVEMSVHLPLVRNIGGMYNPLRCTIFFEALLLSMF